MPTDTYASVLQRLAAKTAYVANINTRKAQIIAALDRVKKDLVDNQIGLSFQSSTDIIALITEAVISETDKAFSKYLTVSYGKYPVTVNIAHLYDTTIGETTTGLFTIHVIYRNDKYEIWFCNA